jgi:hypothetical protein
MKYTSFVIGYVQEPSKGYTQDKRMIAYSTLSTQTVIVDKHASDNIVKTAMSGVI